MSDSTKKQVVEELWKSIPAFPDYSVSNFGRIYSDRSERVLSVNQNQYGNVYVGLMRDGIQYHRSVPLLVAREFVPRKLDVYDTPINMDGDRFNNHVDNLAWRPRWFAVRYNRQFRYSFMYPINLPIQDVKTGEISPNSFECAKRYGLLESDLVMSIGNRTYVWPTYQTFQVIED